MKVAMRRERKMVDYAPVRASQLPNVFYDALWTETQ